MEKVVDPVPGRIYCTLAPMYGIPQATLGWKFRWGDDEFTIFGWESKYRNTPILARRADGKGFRFGVAMIRTLLAKQKGLKWRRACIKERIS